MAKKETKGQRRERMVTMIHAASKAEGFIMACEFAVMIGRRIVDIGSDLDEMTIAQVAVPLGVRPKFVDRAELERLQRIALTPPPMIVPTPRTPKARLTRKRAKGGGDGK